MQRADAVPLAGVRSKILLRIRLALLAHGIEPLEVALQHRILPRQKLDELLHQRARRPLLRQPIENPTAFFETLDQARFRHQFQMPADPRLALPQDLRDLADGEFTLREQRKQPQPRRFRGCFQAVQHVVQAHDHASKRHINISLYHYPGHVLGDLRCAQANLRMRSPHFHAIHAQHAKTFLPLTGS